MLLYSFCQFFRSSFLVFFDSKSSIQFQNISISFGIILLIAWLVAAAAGVNYFNMVNSIITSWFGKLVLLGFTWALFYHLCNGIRHLFWDAGFGFELSTVYKSGYATVAGSIILTATAWVIGITI
mgnify:CR=1 FL=1